MCHFRPTQITWLGHATFKLTTPESKTVLVDPWTYGNPMCPEENKDVGPVDLILITTRTTTASATFGG